MKTSTSNSLADYDPAATCGDCRFDPKVAKRACEFFTDLLTHVKGEQAHKPFILAPWQESIVSNLFGWKRPDGTRRYREAFIYVPRKNGKTTLLAGIVLYMLCCDGEPGAEIYSAAAEREQASLIYDQARGMVLQNRSLSNRCKIYKVGKSIVYEATMSSFKAISADADTKHGFNSHCVVIDELHAQPNRNLVDVLMTSTGSRRQPMIVHITTADWDRESICNEKLDYAKKVRDGVIDDPSFMPVIYEASTEDDWTDPKVWAKVNPNLNVSLSQEYLERECRRAKEQPSFENTFKRLHLNIRTGQETRWFSLENWDACLETLPDLKGRPCYAGLDLANKLDVAAFVLNFTIDDRQIWLPFFWIPADTAEARERGGNVPYLTWSRADLMETTPGNVIDYQYIRRRINELKGEYDIKAIAFDPWNATQFASQLQDEDGIPVVEFRQGYISMNEPCKELEKLIVSGKLAHDGNPVLRWMASNVAVKTDPAGNIKPDKDKSSDKIDGIVAGVMALGLTMQNAINQDSIYESRGIQFV